MKILALVSMGSRKNVIVNEAGAYVFKELAKVNPKHQFVLCLPEQCNGFFEETNNLTFAYYTENKIFYVFSEIQVKNILQEIKPDICIILNDAVHVSSNIPTYRWVTGELKDNYSKFLKHTNVKWFLNLLPDTTWNKQ